MLQRDGLAKTVRKAEDASNDPRTLLESDVATHEERARHAERVFEVLKDAAFPSSSNGDARSNLQGV